MVLTEVETKFLLWASGMLLTVFLSVVVWVLNKGVNN
jgi:hypothetical protein